MVSDRAGVLLTPASTRRLALELGVRPRRSRGQNFLVDANTVRRIVAAAGVEPGARVLEVGPGLGALTLGLLEVGASVCAVELDPTLAAELPRIVATRLPEATARLQVLHADAAGLGGQEFPDATELVANLPYSVAVPVILRALEVFPGLARGLVMVQDEVAHRLVAPPGSRVYGAPSVKAAWWAQLKLAGRIPRSVFWPVPRVDSALVAFSRQPPPAGAERDRVFRLVDAAFAQRRKSLRAALAGLLGSAGAAQRLLESAGIDPARRGETLGLAEFVRLAQCATHLDPPSSGEVLAANAEHHVAGLRGR